MIQPPPAQPGMRLEDVDTPALILDLDVFEANLDRLAAKLDGTGVRLRAHAKTHKSTVIAHLQMARGAVGQCVQKVAEAEIMAWGGVPDIIVTNQVVGGPQAGPVGGAGTDHPDRGVCRRSAASAGNGTGRRSGRRANPPSWSRSMSAWAAAEPMPAPMLWRSPSALAGSRHLEFRGLQAYHGVCPAHAWPR